MSISSSKNTCLICNTETYELHDTKIKVTYDVCPKCDFISKQKEYHLPHVEEKERYDQHNNDEESPGYMNIFYNIINSHIRPLKNVKNILDFGSGPYPMFKKVLDKEGYNVTIYDPFYHNDPAYLTKTYDLITSTEVFEHLANPIKELDTLVSLLKPNGYLCIMTHFRTMDDEAFLNWWYKRDQTHICFFNFNTFEYIKQKYNLVEISRNEKNIIVLQKQ